MLPSAPLPKVLIIDDSTVVRVLTQAALEEAGFAVQTADDGAQGLERVEQFLPDVVVCDMRMPRMGGERVLEQLRARVPQIPVLMFTDASNVDAAVAALRAGAFGYLQKEESAVNLVREIRAAIEHRRLVARNRQLEEIHQRHEAALEKLVAEKEHTAAMVQIDRLAAVGTLAAGVAHEINNPLSYVLANVEYLQRELTRLEPNGALAPAQAAGWLTALAETRHGLERVTQIVADLKGLSRQDEDLSPIELRPIIESSARVAAPSVKPRARFVVQLGELPVVNGNAGRLGQVVLNLLVNAAQAIPEGTTSQHQVTLRGWAAAGRAIIEVQDTGSGMTTEVKARAFEPFFTTKPQGVGTGLGLSICRGIVEAHGGTIQVESEPGQGATFRLELPALY